MWNNYWIEKVIDIKYITVQAQGSRIYSTVPFLEHAHWTLDHHEPWRSSSGTCPSKCRCPPSMCLKTPSPLTSHTQRTSWSLSSPCSPSAQSDHHLKKERATVQSQQRKTSACESPGKSFKKNRLTSLVPKFYMFHPSCDEFVSEVGIYFHHKYLVLASTEKQ